MSQSHPHRRIARSRNPFDRAVIRRELENHVPGDERPRDIASLARPSARMGASV